VPNLIRAFAKDQSGETSLKSPIVHVSKELLKAPANGGSYLSDIGSHMYDIGG
jgi:hypothetical protein